MVSRGHVPSTAVEGDADGEGGIASVADRAPGAEAGWGTTAVSEALPHGLPSGLPQGLPSGLPQGLPSGLSHGLSRLAEGVSASVGRITGWKQDEEEPTGAQRATSALAAAERALTSADPAALTAAALAAANAEPLHASEATPRRSHVRYSRPPKPEAPKVGFAVKLEPARPAAPAGRAPLREMARAVTVERLGDLLIEAMVEEVELSTGHSWEEECDELDRISAISRQTAVGVARRTEPPKPESVHALEQQMYEAQRVLRATEAAAKGGGVQGGFPGRLPTLASAGSKLGGSEIDGRLSTVDSKLARTADTAIAWLTPQLCCARRSKLPYSPSEGHAFRTPLLASLLEEHCAALRPGGGGTPPRLKTQPSMHFATGR